MQDIYQNHPLPMYTQCYLFQDPLITVSVSKLENAKVMMELDSLCIHSSPELRGKAFASMVIRPEARAFIQLEEKRGEKGSEAD